MANNREPVKHDESQSEEEGDEGSSGSEEFDSEAEVPQVSKKAPSSTSLSQPMKIQPHPAAKSPSSSDEYGSETESESDGPDANIGAKKSILKPNDPEPVTPAKFIVTPSKSTVKDAKKAKKTEPDIKPNDDSKKSPFQRVWSEDDEIVILEGMIEYTSKKKSETVANLNLSAFLDFIKKNLHVNVSRSQLQDKIRKLRKKYENNKSKEKEGKERTFSKPHEQKAYQLSKSIWGNDSEESGLKKTKANGSAVRKVPVKKAINAPESEEVKDSKSVMAVRDVGEKKSLGKRVSSGGLSVEERILASGAEFFEAGKGLEGEREWKKLKVEEIELHLKLLEVRTAQTKLYLDALKSEEHLCVRLPFSTF